MKKELTGILEIGADRIGSVLLSIIELPMSDILKENFSSFKKMMGLQKEKIAPSIGFKVHYQEQDWNYPQTENA